MFAIFLPFYVRSMRVRIHIIFTHITLHLE
jgi:hypothetical protein